MSATHPASGLGAVQPALPPLSDAALSPAAWLAEADAASAALFDFMCRADLGDGQCGVKLFDPAADDNGARIVSFEAALDPTVQLRLRGPLRCAAPPHAWSEREVRFEFVAVDRDTVLMRLTDAASALLAFGAFPGTGLGQRRLQVAGRFGVAAPFEIATSPDSHVMDLDAGSVDNGARIQIWDRRYTENQHWRLQESSSAPGYFLLISALSRKAITVADMSPTPGAPLVQWDVNGKDNQLWSIEHAPLEDGRLVFASRANPGLVMDLRGAAVENGAVIEQWTRNGQFNQAWLLRTVRP